MKVDNALIKEENLLVRLVAVLAKEKSIDTKYFPTKQKAMTRTNESQKCLRKL